MSLIVHGIRQCDTMKKALAWLHAQGLAHVLRDYRKQPPQADELQRWCAALGWQALVNTRGTTWRKLGEAERQIADAQAAIALMQRHPSLIRRPVLETGRPGPDAFLAGFDPARYAAVLTPSGTGQP